MVKVLGRLLDLRDSLLIPLTLFSTFRRNDSVSQKPRIHLHIGAEIWYWGRVIWWKWPLVASSFFLFTDNLPGLLDSIAPTTPRWIDYNRPARIPSSYWADGPHSCFHLILAGHMVRRSLRSRISILMDSLVVGAALVSFLSAALRPSSIFWVSYGSGKCPTSGRIWKRKREVAGERL